MNSFNEIYIRMSIFFKHKVNLKMKYQSCICKTNFDMFPSLTIQIK